MISGRGHIITGKALAQPDLAGLSLKKLVLVVSCLLMAAIATFGQTLNDYRTNGNVNFASNSNWERFNGTVWIPAAAAPTSAANIITIRNGHTATVTGNVSLDQLVVNAGGTLTVNSTVTLTVADGAGTDLDVNGTVINYGTITPTGTIVFNSGAEYNHALNGGTIPAATWNPASNCRITGITNSTSMAGFYQVFGNFIWNCPGQTSNFYMASDITIAGDFTVSGTGAFDPNNRALRMSNTSTGYTMTVYGNMIIENNATFKMNNGSGSCFVNVGGNLTLNSGNLTIVTGPANSILSVEGDVSILGGTLGMHEDGSATVATLDLKGNFVLAGTALITETSTGSGLIVFSNTSATQLFTRTGGTISNTVNFTVNPGATLSFGASDYVNGGGTFTLSPGATLQTANPSGINGSVQTSSRVLPGTANYTFNGTAAQITGTYLPATVNNLTINNPAGVTLTNSISVSSLLSMTSGNIITGSNLLTLVPTSPASLNHISGTIVGRFRRGVSVTGTDYLFPVGTNSYYRPAVFNFSSLASATNITAQFIEASPGPFTPYQDDGANQLDYPFTDGYWSLLSSATPVCTYSLSLTGQGFSSFTIDGNSRISGRNAGSTSWSDYGTHGSVDIGNSIITRTGLNVLNTTSFDYCFAGRCAAANAGSDATICRGGSTILNGSGGGTYQWSPVYGLSNPNIANPSANPEVTTTYTLTVTQGACVSTDQVTVFVDLPPAAVLGYAYQKTITIDHSRVNGGTDLYDFPLLINTTDNDLRTILNGGRVQNPNGYDIIFTDANYIRLDHQVESYSASGGSLIAWVRIPVLSSSVNTVIRILYGNPQVTADPSTTAVWKADYQGVWHMGDNPGGSAPQLTDAARTNHGTSAGGMTLANLTGGIIGSSVYFDGTDDYFDVGNGVVAGQKFTEQVWLRASNQADANYHGYLGYQPGGGSAQRAPSIWIYDNNRIHGGFGDGSIWCNWQTPGAVITNDGTSWNHVVVTFDGTDYKLFVNGTNVYSTNSWAGNMPVNTPVRYIGRVDNFFRGSLDEIRVLSAPLSAGWIATEYNNQSSPGTFYSFGPETDCSVFSFTDLCSGAPVTYSVPNTAGHSYNWIVNGGVPSQTTGNSITVTWGDTGPRTIQLEETAGGCTGSSITYSVTPSAQPVAGSVTKDPDITEICVSTSVSATFSGGSGGVNPVDEYESSIDAGATWQPYTPGAPLSSAVAGADRIQVRTRRTSAGAGCSASGWSTVTWNTVDQPAGPALNIKTPDLVTVCEGQAVSALFSAGTGGAGCSDSFRYRYDGSGTWFAYTPGDNIATTGHNQVEIQGRRDGCIAEAGCTETPWITLATWNIEPQPSSPALNIRTPDLASVCEGQPVSATFLPGAGGVGCIDIFQYRYDGAGPWMSYTPGVDISTTGHTLVEIRIQRAGCDEDTGCSGTGWVTVASWNVVQQPAGPSLAVKTPNQAAVCDGVTVSATFNPGSGGIGCSDSFRYRLDGAGAWVGYTPGTDINTTGHTLVEIEGQRSGCDAGTGCSESGWITLASWIINPLPSPVITGDNEVCPGAMGIKYSVPSTDGHTYTWVITGASSYSGANTNEVTVNWAFNCNTTGSVRVTETITATGCSVTTADYPVIIRDNVAPVWITPAGSLNQTLQCSDAAAIAAAQTLFPVATDNCDTDVENIDKISGSFVPGAGCPEAGTYTNTWTVTDACGNTSGIFTQVITIIDTQAPVWTTTPGALNVILECSDAAGIAAAQAFFPVATDNCDTDVTDIVKVSGAFVPGGTCPEAGTYTNTWTVTDNCGNTSGVYTQVITITDTQAPAWVTLPGALNRTVECDDGGALTAAQALFPVASDNCDPDVANIVKEEGTFVTGVTCPQAGTITNRWRVTDACGNVSAYYIQVITITDTQAPAWTTAPGVLDRTVEFGDSDALQEAQALLPEATDNCDTDLSNVVKITGLFVPGGTCPVVGSYTNTFTVTDDCGNISLTYTQVITVTDTEAPVWINAENELDRIVECSDADEIAAAQGLFPVALDNFDTDLSNIVKTPGAFVPDGSCTEGGTYTNTWTITDDCGNTSAVYTQVITVIDTEAPVWTTPANSLDRTVQCSDATGLADAQNLVPVASDKCDTDVTNITKTPGAFVPVDNPYEGTYTNTWTVTDNCGNVSDVFVQVITVIDNTPPVIVCPLDITINCEDDSSPSVTGTATATDNCTPNDDIVIAFTDISTYNTDPSSIDHYNYTITRTWIATDLTGNFSECIQTITVEDKTPPLILCPADATLNCEDDNTPSALGTATATDICAPVTNITISRTDASTYNPDPSNADHYNYVITRTWRATDVAGNSSECEQTITVQDITPPVIACPDDVTVSCEDDNTPAGTGYATATDNCAEAGNISVTWSDLSTFIADPSNAGHYNYVITRTWRATDVAGNFSECVQTITVQDTTDPDFSVPPTVTICRAADCTYNADPSVTGDVTDESDNCTPDYLLDAAWADDLSGITDCNIAGFITRTWTLTDISGNTTSKIQIIWVEPTPTATIVNNTPVICDSASVNLVFDSPTVSTNPGNLSFEIVITSSDPANLSGTASAGFTITKAQMPYLLDGTLINTSDAPIEVTFTINSNLAGCSEFVPVSSTVWVNPTPRIFPVPDPNPAPQCDSTATNILLQSPSTFTSGDVSFKYVVSATGGVTGFTTPVTGRPNNHIIADVLVNPTDEPQTVTYVITPVSPLGCNDGPSQTVVVTVNPTPRISPVPDPNPAPQCDSTATNILLQSPSTFTSGDVSFKYTVTATGGVTGFTTPVTGRPNNHIIADVLVNPTDQPQTVTYVITPVSPLGCNDGPSQTVVVTVNPTPRIFPVPDPNPSPQCDSTATNILLQSPSTFTSGDVSFKYTVSATGGVTGFTTPVTGRPNNHVIADVLVNPTDEPQTVTYVITPVSPLGCNDGPSQTVVVTVNPTPRIFPVPISSIQCDSTTTSITLVSPSTFTSGFVKFNLSASAPAGLTGYTSSASGLDNNHVIADYLVNATDGPLAVTYTITPLSPVGCNNGPSQTFTVTVNPTPRIFPVPDPNPAPQCDSTATNILLQSPSTFTSGDISFKYTVTATGGVTGFTTPVTGRPNNHVIADMLVNPTDEPQTVTYVITPVSPLGCNDGPSQTVVVTINPTPRIFPLPDPNPAPQCDSTATNILLQSPSTFSSGDVSFKYTVSATGGVTGFTTPVTGRPNNHVIADVLVNPTDEPQTVTYVITPVSPLGCNDGPSQTIVVTVNPTPRIFPVPDPNPAPQCDSTATNILLQSPSTFTSGEISFKYTVSATGGVTGFTTPVTGRPNNHIIADVLVNPTDQPQTVTYVITPVSPLGCNDGPSQTVIITVNPTPRIFPVPDPNPAPQCDSTATNILLQSPSTFTSGDVSFKYVVSATGGVTGFTTPVTGRPNNHVIADVLVNPTDEPQTVTYVITPVSPLGCNDGPSQTVIITVNPTPRIFPVPISSIQCDSTTTNILLQSPSTFTSGDVSFKYTVSATGGVTGFTTPVTGRPNNHVIADVLVNPTDEPQTVTYVLTPVSPVGCNDGPSQTVVVTVNPTPRIFPVPDPNPAPQCDSTATNILLQSPSTFTSGDVSFKYTVTATGGVTGFTTPVINRPNNHIIADVLVNPTDEPQTVTYVITPVSPLGCNDGPSQTVVITVNPTPRIFPVPISSIQCDSTTTSITLVSPSTFTSGSVKFNLSASAPAGLSGYTSSASGLDNGHVIADYLVNATDGPLAVTYTITPLSPVGCNNGPSQTFTVTVNPTPRIFPVPDPNPAPQCDSTATNILLQSPSTFTSGEISFKYTVSATGGVTGFTTPVTGRPNNHIIADMLVNPTDEPQTVTYVITPVSPLGCNDGPSQTVVVTVNPTPRIFPVPPSVIQCDSTNTSITLLSPTVFTSGDVTFKFTATATGGVTGHTPSATLLPVGHIIEDFLINPTDAPQTVTYRVVPVSPLGCGDGPAQIITVTINPTPRIYPVPPDIIQCDSAITNIVLQSPSTFTSGLISFRYTVVATGGVTGFTTPVSGLPNNYVIVDQLVNPTDAPQTVTYTIYPVSPLACNEGPRKIVTVIINPTPRFYVTAVADTLCSNETSLFTITTPTTLTAGNVYFNYTIEAVSGDLTVISGYTTSAGVVIPGPGPVTFTQTITNHTNDVQWVQFRLHPYSRNTGGGDCDHGPARDTLITLIVEPIPRVSGLISNDTICNNSPITYNLITPTTAIYGVRFNVRVVNPYPEISGAFDRDNLSTLSVITETLENSGDIARMIMYVVTPATITNSGIQKCPGINDTIRLWINPTPRALPINATPAICYGDLTSITLLSPTVMTRGDIRFDYTVTSSGLPGDITGSFNPVTDKLQGDVIASRYRNYYDSVLSVFFTITPKSSALACNPGDASVQEVQVHPKPNRGIVILKPLTCDVGSGLATISAIISRGADPYHLVWDGPVGFHAEDSVVLHNVFGGQYTLRVTDNLSCTGDTLINVIPLTARPQIFAFPILPNIHVSCPGGSDGTVRVYVNFGITAPYRYWVVRNGVDTLFNGILINNYNPADPTTFRIFTGLPAGEYTLIIRDVHDCEVTRSAELLAPDPVIVEFGLSDYSGYNVSCRGYSNGSVWVENITGGNGGYTFEWYPESGFLDVSTDGPLLDSIPAGKYYLRTTDLLGCVKIDSVLLTEPDGMVLTGSEVSLSQDGAYNISCNGSSEGFIKLTIEGGSGQLTYLWEGPDGYSSTARDITGLRAGIYTCTVTDINGCILMPMPQFTLTEPMPLQTVVVKSSSVEGSHNISCFGGTGSAEITVTGGSEGNYTYTWSTSDGSGIVAGQKDQMNLTAGTYHLIVRDINGCTDERDIVLTQPGQLVLTLDPTQITCESAGFDNGEIDVTVAGGIGPYLYIWSTGEVTEDISGLTVGDYTVTVTDMNGCQTTGSASINLPPPLAYSMIVSEYNGYNITCNGKADGSIEITPTSGMAPYTINWQGPDGFSSNASAISGLKAGLYILHIRDNNICEVTDTIEIAEPGRLGMTVTPSLSMDGNFNINCAGASTGTVEIQALNNAGSVQYIWSDGEIGSRRENLMAGSYRVIITDANNCYADSTFTLSQPTPMMMSFEVTPPFCPDMPDGTIELTVTGGVSASGYAYLWSDNSTDQNLTGVTKGKYSVTVTDNNGCQAEGATDVSSQNPICLVIPNAFTPNSDGINDEWVIGLVYLYPQLEVTIFNRWGEVIWKSEKGYPRPWDGRSGGSLLPMDSYHYIIDLNNGSRPIVGHVTIVK